MLACTLLVTNLMEKRGVPIPQAIVTIGMGIFFGFIASTMPRGFSRHAFEKFEDLSARAFMLVFIAPIIFAEGYGLKSRQFFRNTFRIMTSAFLGTVISTIVVAYTVFYLPPVTGLPPSMQLSLAECFCFGAMISATDPVTTLAIFKDLRLVERGVGHLYYSVLGESILNDAVAITLFVSFGELVKRNEEITSPALVGIARDFCITFGFSSVIGVLFGIFTALILKFSRLGGGHTDEADSFSFNVPEIGVVFVLAYMPFLIAEAISLSGIVAIMFAGIAMRHYAHYNMTSATRLVFLPTCELIANLSETYVFLVLGLGCFLLCKSNWSAVFFLWTAVACLAGRAIIAYPLSWIVNVFASNGWTSTVPMNLNEQHVVWFAGLRGAVAFMCALGFPVNEKNPDPTTEGNGRQLVIFTTMIFVGMTLFMFGWPTATILQCLRVIPENETVAAESIDNGTEERQTFLGALLNEIDNRLLKLVMMTGPQMEREETLESAASAPPDPLGRKERLDKLREAFRRRGHAKQYRETGSITERSM
eukprot:TRINITY_DN3241_c0_g1_i1.p1 TRINITY_DN3241_c0_g1~~TRINITY_DN3241_c0_g1_i1.p1  ORF type:complete len:599 (+),score=92.42 TRINITY_DN3241_c0_g1_i1:195-1799(+)